MPLSEQEIRRREEREALEERGVNPYPYAWDVTAHAAEILETFDDEKHDPETGEVQRVSVAGRMMSKRVMGKAAFFDLHDSSGKIQVYVRRDDLPEGFYNQVFKKLLDIGDVVGVEGFVFRTRMGEVTVHAERLALLAKALRPLPVVKETDEQVYNEVTDKEFRYRQRYVDLVVNPEVREVFQQRARMISTMRRFLDERGYLEVETPVLQPIYGGAAARPFTTYHNTYEMPLYLRIADELYLKRLIVGGFDGVYEISKDFRNEGVSRFHNPEFTMMELYVAYKDYRWMMDLVEEMIETIVLDLHGTTEITYGEHTLSFARPWKRIPIFEAIEARTGRDLYGKDRDDLAAAARALGLKIDSTMGAGKIIDEVFGTFVEPDLIQPAFVIDHPVELSPLAKRHRDTPGLVERFETICIGKEICNAFSELNDPADQRARFEEQLRLSEEGDEEALRALDEDYLRALEYGMPPTAGLGVGIDRLAMILTGQFHIRDVILFPLLRPEETFKEKVQRHLSTIFDDVKLVKRGEEPRYDGHPIQIDFEVTTSTGTTLWIKMKSLGGRQQLSEKEIEHEPADLNKVSKSNQWSSGDRVLLVTDTVLPQEGETAYINEKPPIVPFVPGVNIHETKSRLRDILGDWPELRP